MLLPIMLMCILVVQSQHSLIQCTVLVTRQDGHSVNTVQLSHLYVVVTMMWESDATMVSLMIFPGSWGRGKCPLKLSFLDYSYLVLYSFIVHPCPPSIL